MITDVRGVAVGHWTDERARTGCTVIVLPPGTVASGEIRGGAPATREFALLDPSRLVTTVDAVVLSGGSAFGLSAADGVMRGLEERGRGFETKVGPVPIVVGLSLFDLAVGDPAVRPGPDQGLLALAEATERPYDNGPVGAGTGATVDKWSGQPVPGGLGSATLGAAGLIVSALLAVNAYGSIDDGRSVEDIGPPDGSTSGQPFANTTIGIVVTNAAIDKAGCFLLAQSAHDGLARSLLPAHTLADGDGLVAAATGEVEADLFHLRALTQAAVAAAVRSVGGP